MNMALEYSTNNSRLFLDQIWHVWLRYVRHQSAGVAACSKSKRYKCFIYTAIDVDSRKEKTLNKWQLFRCRCLYCCRIIQSGIETQTHRVSGTATGVVRLDDHWLNTMVSFSPWISNNGLEALLLWAGINLLRFLKNRDIGSADLANETRHRQVSGAAGERNATILTYLG